jgi:hypothetical protein
MDPSMMLALASAAGAAGGSRGGKTSTTQSTQQNVSVASPVAQSLNLAFSPILSALTGGGPIAPSGFGGLYGAQSQTPSSSANPTTSQALSEGAGSVLPRYSPTGYSTGPGFGLYPNMYQQPARGLLGNDTFFLFVIAGAIFWFAFQET